MTGVSVQISPLPRDRQQAPPSSFKSAEFNVEGMRCEYCAAEITTTLERYKGVKSADVDLTANRATVIYDSRAVTPQALAEEGR
ncbi:MAG: heavy-metal-associated domain-containing protein [Deltaproteobacteria bacterium]|nr:heavy-metal-associated domain-containing protein [Deltaproteobacteria bacterium]